jgi:KaiC/GvpD/RAD55 family RecA-like ATPase
MGAVSVEARKLGYRSKDPEIISCNSVVHALFVSTCQELLGPKSTTSSYNVVPVQLENLSKEESLSVPIISDILKGPIRRGNILVLFYEPSAQWLSLILTSALGLLRRGYSVGIATTTTPPSQVRRRLATALPNLSELETAKQLTIVDWYTWMTGKKSSESRSVDTLGLAQFNIQDSKYQRDDSPVYDFLANDNLSAFLKYNDERAFMQWLDKTIARMRELKGVRLYCFMKHFHSGAFYANLEAMADGVIELDLREERKHLENVIRLRSMTGIQHPTEWRILKITPSGFLELVSSRR